jgi:hypothetical protein
MTTIGRAVFGLVLAVGMTAQARAACEENELTMEMHFDAVSSVGPGDAEVNSQNGRTTSVAVRTASLVNHGSYLTITVTYEVTEGRPDFTHLRETKNFTIQAPQGCRITKFGSGRVHENFSKNFAGKDHNWHDIREAVHPSGTYFSELKVKFDDVGRDDTGNAQLTGTLAIPVELVAE